MTKSAVVFQDKPKRKRNVNTEPQEDNITLSIDKYRERLHEAYLDGKKEAEVEKQDSSSQNSHNNALEEGKEEAIKEHAKEREENKQRFKTISERQNIELLRVESVFPFTLFPDTLIIDTTKISISKKQLFATEYITTIPLKDLGDVNVQTVLFLGTLYIKYMPQANSPGMNEAVTI